MGPRSKGRRKPGEVNLECHTYFLLELWTNFGRDNWEAKKLGAVFDRLAELGTKKLENMAYQGTLKSFAFRVRVNKWFH